MNEPQTTQLIPVEHVERLIHLARGEKVLLDADLAMRYGVSTGNLNKAVKRNQQRFPPDFMFQLSDEETAALIFQSGRSSDRGGRRAGNGVRNRFTNRFLTAFPFNNTTSVPV